MGRLIPNMGMNEAKVLEGGLAEALFSPVQQRVLGLLFGQPERRFQSAELIRMADSGTGATHRVLKRLARSGLVQVHQRGREKHYQANPASPIYEELVGLVRKTVGLVEPLREALWPVRERVLAAFVYGSVASGSDRADSDIDLLVIARDLDYATLFEALRGAEQKLGRRLHPTLLAPEEWQRKRGGGESLASRIEGGSRLFVIGSENDLA